MYNVCFMLGLGELPSGSVGALMRHDLRSAIGRIYRRTFAQSLQNSWMFLVIGSVHCWIKVSSLVISPHIWHVCSLKIEMLGVLHFRNVFVIVGQAWRL